MKTIINTENIQTFIQQIPTLTNNLQNISQTMKGFVDCLKQNKLTPTTQETYQEEYERKEGILKKEGELDKLEMTMKKREEVTKKSKDTIEILQQIIQSIEKITEKTQKMNKQSGIIHAQYSSKTHRDTNKAWEAMPFPCFQVKRQRSPKAPRSVNRGAFRVKKEGTMKHIGRNRHHAALAAFFV